MEEHLEAYRKILAWIAGQPMPRGKFKNVFQSDPSHVLLLAWVRMGGEYAPWGVAWGHPGEKPNFLVIPDPRHFEKAWELVARWSENLLRFLGHPQFGGTLSENEPRQIWVPNSSHITMFHYLNYAFHSHKKGPPGEVAALQSLGRACGWLFRESERPGQCTIVSAADSLKKLWVTPSIDFNLNHLGYALAWLKTQGTRQERFSAALKAEEEGVSITLDPLFERSLTDEMESYDAAIRNGQEEVAKGFSEKIYSKVSLELERRFRLTEEAFSFIRADKRKSNPGFSKLIEKGHQNYLKDYIGSETKILNGQWGYVPHPETDYSPMSATIGYLNRLVDETTALSTLIPFEPELKISLITGGEGFRGEIKKVDVVKVGRGKEITWTIETEAHLPLRLKEGDLITFDEFPKIKGKVFSVDSVLNKKTGIVDRRHIVLEMTKGKRGDSETGIPALHETDWESRTVTFLNLPDPKMIDLKKARLFKNTAAIKQWVERNQLKNKNGEADERGIFETVGTPEE